MFVEKQKIVQVDDYIALLDLMIQDAENAPTSQFDATPHSRWLKYSDNYLEILRKKGLNDFRQPRALPNSFGAIDKNPNGISANEMLHIVRTSFISDGMKRIDELLPSRVGNPECFEVDNGGFFTLSWLNFYCRYAYVSKFMTLSNQIIVEIGSGSGKQAEMLKKAHPDLTILLFDLPTQLYVCNQYLSKVFEGTNYIADYHVGRNVNNFSEIKHGKINILPHWKSSILYNAEFDLLWNAASFQEMAKPTALAYFKVVNKAKNLYLMHNIKYAGMKEFPGERGVISDKYLKDFKEIDRNIAHLAYTPKNWIYFDSFWRHVSSDKAVGKNKWFNFRRRG